MKNFALVIAALLICLMIPGWSGAQDVQKLITQGMEDSQAGRLDQALLNFSQALKLKPNDPAILTYRGIALYAKGQHDQALKDFGQAISADPKFAKAYYQRALVYDSLQKYELAVADLKKAQSLGYNVDPVFLQFLEHKETSTGGWRK